jgi:hypothetical protein
MAIAHGLHNLQYLVGSLICPPNYFGKASSQRAVMVDAGKIANWFKVKMLEFL